MTSIFTWTATQECMRSCSTRLRIVQQEANEKAKNLVRECHCSGNVSFTSRQTQLFSVFKLNTWLDMFTKP